ncbi:eukaryotic elongation factor 2 kinase-related [Anaeramoeba flamelloides]|uniref:Eukaryotic elongation factor 2 kinase-related n=1 Tax=Anaeramoeba flamelloides TaxID=1746091 RepID=A0ABQ8XQD0_9EUKA|nr:eukaryotic elongation factor 2 kinase-related [Anaeramoeba flamelloides]
MTLAVLPYCYQQTTSNDIFLLQLENGKRLIGKINLKYRDLSIKEQFRRYRAEIKNHTKITQYIKEWNNLNSRYSIDYLNKMVIEFKTEKSPHHNYVLIAEPFKEDGCRWEKYNWFSPKANEKNKIKMEELIAFEHYAFLRSNKTMFVRTKKGFNLTPHNLKGGIYSSPKIITLDHYQKQSNMQIGHKQSKKSFIKYFKSKHKCSPICKKLKLSSPQTDLKKIKINHFSDEKKKRINRYSICNDIFCAQNVGLTLKQYSKNPNKICFNCIKQTRKFK